MKSALSKFLVRHRETIELRATEVFSARSGRPTEEVRRGVPLFVEPLIGGETGAECGRRLVGLGFTLSDLVHGYGSLREVVTKLAGEAGEDIATGDLDAALAEGVTAHERERIGALAHELRNALYAATVSLQLIKKGAVALGDPTSDALDRSLALMGALVDRSLAEVRPKTDATPPTERFRLADAVDQVRATLRQDAEHRDRELRVEIDGELTVETDRRLLVSVVSNLAQNALRSTREGGKASLRARRTDGRLVIEVEDECGGLPPGAIDEMFLPFVRGSQPRPGASLGLSIARRAIEDINGELRVRDLPGQGCVFIVDLPDGPVT